MGRRDKGSFTQSSVVELMGSIGFVIASKVFRYKYLEPSWNPQSRLTSAKPPNDTLTTLKTRKFHVKQYTLSFTCCLSTPEIFIVST